jgi:DNA-binding GntR family transcriptional regulator
MTHTASNADTGQSDGGRPTDLLRAEILRGTLSPGQRLIEVELAGRYGVGRAAIRTALTELDKEGLVERHAHRGAVVRRITVAEAVQITEARAELESLLARRAASLSTPAEQAELAGIIADMRTQVGALDFVAYSGSNRRLHARIRELSQHRVGAELVENLRNRSASHQFRLAVLPGRPEQSLQEHAEIVAAISAGDEERAAVAMRRHLLAVIASIHRFEDGGLPF